MSDTESAPRGPSLETVALSPSGAADGEGAAPPAIGPGDTIGRYQIRGILGAGGMGQVFTALDPELGRTVALKLIRPDGRAQSARARMRLLREAQALAKLQHPNVVAIHDVGTEGDQVFIAMELVSGPTLGNWLRATPRTWLAIRDVFVAAGRGLAAAHVVGIIHRDFKPSNVIVGANRVVVVDFGLACAHGDDSAREDSDSGGATSVLDVNMTLTGERVGTPRYMAPEQHAGDPVTPQADQFAFATALCEALYGAAPFPGASRDEVLERMARGLPPLPGDRNVPERVRAALARALAFRPGDRWPALDDLLAELTRDPSAGRRRRLAIVAVSLAAIAVPVAFIAGRQAFEPSCATPAPDLWDEATRAEVRKAFLATHKSFAGDSFERVDAALRTRLADWSKAREEACAATEIRHEQSAALMDARMGCLARARDQISALVSVLRTVDADGVERATEAAPSIGDLATCADVPALTAMLPAPRDPATLATIDEIDRETARVEALVLVGRMKEAHDAGPALVERARALGHPPLLARALFGVASCQAGDPREATALLYEAARAAGAAHDDALAAQIYTRLVYCVGARDENVPGAQALAEAAEAALARAGSPPELRAQLYREEGSLRERADDFINALAFAELALMSSQRVHGEDSYETGLDLGNVGDILMDFGAYRGSLAAYARALPILERTRGPTHPTIPVHLANLGATAAEAGDLEGAAVAFERALALALAEEEQYGPTDAAVSNTLLGLSNVRQRQGQLDTAWDLGLRARAIDEKTLRPDHPHLAQCLDLLAGIAIDRGAIDEAQALADKAFAGLAAAYGPDHSQVADVEVLLAQIARKRHDLPGARRHLEKALAVQRSALGSRHPIVASSQSALAAILLETGAARAALPLLEEALTIQEGARNDDADEVVIARTLLAEALLATGQPVRALALAERAVAAVNARHARADIDGRARFALAQALGLGKGDRPRARELAGQARALLQGSPAADEVARVDRWLADTAPAASAASPREPARLSER